MPLNSKKNGEYACFCVDVWGGWGETSVLCKKKHSSYYYYHYYYYYSDCLQCGDKRFNSTYLRLEETWPNGELTCSTLKIAKDSKCKNSFQFFKFLPLNSSKCAAGSELRLYYFL